MPPHPGCKCGHCYGLAEHLATEGLNTRAIATAPGHTTQAPLRLVQATDNEVRLHVPQCNSSMTCDCQTCQAQRAVLIAHGPKRVRQPWNARRAA